MTLRYYFNETDSQERIDRRFLSLCSQYQLIGEADDTDIAAELIRWARCDRAWQKRSDRGPGSDVIEDIFDPCPACAAILSVGWTCPTPLRRRMLFAVFTSDAPALRQQVRRAVEQAISHTHQVA